MPGWTAGTATTAAPFTPDRPASPATPSARSPSPAAPPSASGARPDRSARPGRTRSAPNAGSTSTHAWGSANRAQARSNRRPVIGSPAAAPLEHIAVAVLLDRLPHPLTARGNVTGEGQANLEDADDPDDE